MSKKSHEKTKHQAQADHQVKPSRHAPIEPCVSLIPLRVVVAAFDVDPTFNPPPIVYNPFPSATSSYRVRLLSVSQPTSPTTFFLPVVELIPLTAATNPPVGGWTLHEIQMHGETFDPATGDVIQTDLLYYPMMSVAMQANPSPAPPITFRHALFAQPMSSPLLPGQSVPNALVSENLSVIQATLSDASGLPKAFYQYFHRVITDPTLGPTDVFWPLGNALAV